MPWRGNIVYESLKIQNGNCARKQNKLLFWVLFSFSAFVFVLYMNVMVVLNDDELDVDRLHLLTTIPMAYFVFIFVSRFSLARIKWLKSKPYDYPYKFSLDILLNSLQQVYLSSQTEIRPNIRHHPCICPPDQRVDTRNTAGLSCEVCTGRTRSEILHRQLILENSRAQ